MKTRTRRIKGQTGREWAFGKTRRGKVHTQGEDEMGKGNSNAEEKNKESGNKKKIKYRSVHRKCRNLVRKWLVYVLYKKN